MGGKEVPGPGRRQRDHERIPGPFHETASALKQSEGRVPFVEVAHFRFDAECIEQSPATQPKYDLLLQAQLGITTVQLTGDAAVNGDVGCVVRVQKVEPLSTYLNLPGAQPHGRARQRDL